jgi:hypothetical protein
MIMDEMVDINHKSEQSSFVYSWIEPRTLANADATTAGTDKVYYKGS